MDQKQIYQKIATTHAAAIESGMVSTDDYLAGRRVDKRRGISLIIPCVRLGAAYQALRTDFLQSCPGQYLYPLEDLHITVFDYIPGSVDYKAESELDRCYMNVTQEVLRGFAPLYVEFKGVVFSAAAGMICGYDKGRLVKLRETIRNELHSRNITFAERYASQTAHVTFMRFVHSLEALERFVKCRKAYDDYDFGFFELTEMQLLEHDWYNQQKNTRLIKAYSLI